MATKAAMSLAPSSEVLCEDNSSCIRRNDLALLTYHRLSILGVREADTNGLVDEENVRVFVPRVGIEGDVMDVVHSAWSLRK